MKAVLISCVVGALVIVATMIDFTHHPTSWECIVQKVAHDGDTTGVLWKGFSTYDSLMFARDEEPTTENWLVFYKAYLQTLTTDQLIEISESTKRCGDGMYSFTWDYYGTSVGWPARKSREIYPIKVKWWKRSIANSKTS